MPRKRPTESREETTAREDFKRVKELNDLKSVLADKRVRDFLWRFMEQCHPFSEQMNPNFGVTGHNLGRRAMAMWLWAEINEADFECLLLMQRDAALSKIDPTNSTDSLTEQADEE